MTADPRKERETRLRDSDSGLGDPDRQREAGRFRCGFRWAAGGGRQSPGSGAATPCSGGLAKHRALNHGLSSFSFKKT